MTKSRHTAAMASILVVASFLPSVAWGQTTIDELQEQLSALEADVASETEDIAAVWRGLGDAYYQIGAYEDAIPYYQNALAYCEADPATYAQDIAEISHRLGFAYEQTGSAVEAIAYLERAIPAYETRPTENAPVIAAAASATSRSTTSLMVCLALPRKSATLRFTISTMMCLAVQLKSATLASTTLVMAPVARPRLSEALAIQIADSAYDAVS